MATVLPPPPPVLSGRYRLDRRVAQGGMAEVWLATDQLLTRQVAVKLLKPSLAADPVIAERFRREAIAVAQLNHPNVVAVYDTVDEGGRQAVVMQFVRGRSLREILDAERRLSPERTIQVGIAVAAALGAAHEAGLVHRDVKPGNIMLTDENRVLLTDFGIAKGADDGDLTSDNVMMGTAKYLSPEQVRGRRLDGRADLYSLGLVLYECLAGRVPFQADTDAATALARLQRDPTPLLRLRPTLQSGLVELIHRLLARNPDDRPASSAAVQTTLERILAAPVAEFPPTAAIDRPANAAAASEASAPAAGPLPPTPSPVVTPPASVPAATPIGEPQPSGGASPGASGPALAGSTPANTTTAGPTSAGPAPGAGAAPSGAARVAPDGRPAPSAPQQRDDRSGRPVAGSADGPRAQTPDPSSPPSKQPLDISAAPATRPSATPVRPAPPTGPTPPLAPRAPATDPGGRTPGSLPDGRRAAAQPNPASIPNRAASRRSSPEQQDRPTASTPQRPVPPAPGRAPQGGRPMPPTPRSADRDRSSAPTPSQPVMRPGAGHDHTPASGTIHGRPARQFQQRWAPSMVIVGGLLAIALVIALILASGVDSEQQGTPPTNTAPVLVAITTVPTTVDDGIPPALDSAAASVFDPKADGENDGDLPLIFDGSESTVWNTECYQDKWMGAQQGIGVLIPLTKPSTGALDVTFAAPDWQAAVYASNSLPTDLTGWGSPLDTSYSETETTHRFTLGAQPHNFVMVWLSKLPRDRAACSGNNPYRGGLAEVVFTPGAG